ncbi:MAG: hypothetical protein ACREVL_11800, partial [Solimonas sp.]
PVADAAGRLIDNYETRVRGLREEQDTPQSVAARGVAELELRLVGIDAERREIKRLHRIEQINDTVYNELLYELDVRESALNLRGRKKKA